MGNELPLVKSATSTLYEEPTFLNIIAFSLVTKSGASTIPWALHKGVGMSFYARSLLIFLGPPKVVQYLGAWFLGILSPCPGPGKGRVETPHCLVTWKMKFRLVAPANRI